MGETDTEGNKGKTENEVLNIFNSSAHNLSSVKLKSF